MKLHLAKLGRPLDKGCVTDACCAVDLLSILLQKPIDTINRMVIRRRKKLHYRGYLHYFRNQTLNDIDALDWREVVAIIRKGAPNVRSRTARRFNVINFAKQREGKSKFTYVVFIHEHVLLIRNGLIYDNYCDGEDPSNYIWRDSRVLYYCVLRNPIRGNLSRPREEPPTRAYMLTSQTSHGYALQYQAGVAVWRVYAFHKGTIIGHES
jgi:hypothetical protein